VPRRDGEPQDVGAGAGVPLGELAGQGGDLRVQDRLGADDPTQRDEPAGVVALSAPSEHEPVDVLAGEADLHPRAGDGGLGHRRWDGVVEGAIEVREGHVDQHPRHRVDGRRRGLGRLARSGRPGFRLGGLHRRPSHARQQLRVLVVGGHGRSSTSAHGRARRYRRFLGFTGRVAVDVAVAVAYPVLLPMTRTEIRLPWSAAVKVYVDRVAREIGAPLRSHW
jgi:hypothetical protein